MVSIKELRYMIAVANNKNFKKAAEQCFVSPSTLSTAIMQLESKLKVTIFERDNKKVLITPTGKEIITLAQKIIQDIKKLAHINASKSNPFCSTISIGIIPTIAPFLLPSFFRTFKQNYPDALVNIEENQSATLLEKVRSGALDTAIIALPYQCDGLLTLPFWDEDFSWIYNPNFFHYKKESIKIDQLKEQKIILLSDGNCLKDHIIDFCNLSMIQNHYSVNASSISTLFEMVRSGLGTTLIPNIAIKQLLRHTNDLNIIPLSDKGPHRTLAFVMRPNYSRSHSVECLIEICKMALTANYESNSG